MDNEQGKAVAMEAFLGGNRPHQGGLEVTEGEHVDVIGATPARGEVAMSTEAARRMSALAQAAGMWQGTAQAWKARAECAEAKLQRIDAMLSAYQLGAPMPTYSDLRGVLSGDLTAAELGGVGGGGVGIVSW